MRGVCCERRVHPSHSQPGRQHYQEPEDNSIHVGLPPSFPEILRPGFTMLHAILSGKSDYCALACAWGAACGAKRERLTQKVVRKKMLRVFMVTVQSERKSFNVTCQYQYCP